MSGKSPERDTQLVDPRRWRAPRCQRPDSTQRPQEPGFVITQRPAGGYCEQKVTLSFPRVIRFLKYAVISASVIRNHRYRDDYARTQFEKAIIQVRYAAALAVLVAVSFTVSIASRQRTARVDDKALRNAE